MNATPYPFAGPPELREPVLRALRKVVDPEVAMSIVDVGLVYGVTIADGAAVIDLTMTSAACPVADVIMDDVEQQLDRVLPEPLLIQVRLVWEPPWTPERLSAQARSFMGW